MKRWLAVALASMWAATAAAQMPNLNDVMKGLGSVQPSAKSGSVVGAGDDRTNAAGIKEALAVGTERAVNALAKPDGFFGNQAVKILLPSSIQRASDVARMAGFQKQVDEFILSMNRAAEAAVPVAARYFGDAIRDMSVDDVRGILGGGDTAATDFFRRKTHDKLFAAFKPIVSTKVDEVGATRAYKAMMSKYEAVPMMGGGGSLDLDEYVTNKTLDGVFYMLGQEEKNIRTNPMARSTDLLKSVFGSAGR